MLFLETLSYTFLPDIAKPLFVPHLCPAVCLNYCKYKAWDKETLSENRIHKKTETQMKLKGVKRGERLSNPCCSGISEKKITCWWSLTTFDNIYILKKFPNLFKVFTVPGSWRKQIKLTADWFDPITVSGADNCIITSLGNWQMSPIHIPKSNGFMDYTVRTHYSCLRGGNSHICTTAVITSVWDLMTHPPDNHFFSVSCYFNQQV